MSEVHTEAELAAAAKQAEADESARIYANATGSRGATYIIQTPDGKVVGRYARCVEWDMEKNTICGIEITHTPCPFHTPKEG